MAQQDHGNITAIAQSATTSASPNPFHYLRVLLIEDNDEIRELMRHFIEDSGFHNITECVDGHDALELLDMRMNDFDLIICDWNLPRVSGNEILRHVRMANQTLPFIMITSRADFHSVLIAKQDGVDAYLRKPFLQSELQNKIHRILQTKNP